jgi:lipopolysaccharide transport system permease protein
LLPAALIAAGFADLLIATPVLVAVALAHGFAPNWRMVAIVPCAALAALTALGAALWLVAPLYARYRDVRFVLPFAVQVWFFATPVVYASEVVPHGWQTVLALNPMVAVVEGFRWAITGSSAIDVRAIATSIAMAILLAASGWAYFARVDRKLADIV